MESRIQQALERHRKGYNCAQAVVCTYCDMYNVEEQTAFRLSESFGFGMGTQGVCGALSGALMLLGLQNSGGMMSPGKTKGDTYRKAREMTQEFENCAGALLCKEIKAPPVQCSCDECIACACRIAEKYLPTNT